MWTAVITGVTSLVSSWFATKQAKQEAEAEFQKAQINTEMTWDLYALRMSQFSWKDELITVIWFAPLVVAWFNPQQAMEWVTFVSQLPVFYQIGMFGIMAASFGLRWFFKQQGLKVKDIKK